MPIEFYEMEYAKMKKEYNRIYRLHTTPDLKSQCNVIVAMVTLGRLCEKLSRTSDRNVNPEYRIRFIQTRNWLQSKFQQIENDVRGYHDRKNRLTDRYQGKYLPELRQSLPGHMAKGGR